MTNYTDREKQETLRLMANMQDKASRNNQARRDAARELIATLAELNNNYGFSIRIDAEKDGVLADVSLPRPRWKQDSNSLTVGYSEENGFFLIHRSEVFNLEDEITYDPFAKKFVGPKKIPVTGERDSALTTLMRKILIVAGHGELAVND